MVNICYPVDGSSILQTIFSTLSTDSFVSCSYPKPVSSRVLLSNAFHAVTLPCPANGLTVPPHGKQAKQKVRKHPIYFMDWHKLGSHLRCWHKPYFPHKLWNETIKSTRTSLSLQTITTLLNPCAHLNLLVLGHTHCAQDRLLIFGSWCVHSANHVITETMTSCIQLINKFLWSYCLVYW